MQKWEYKIVPNCSEGDLNSLGEDGWELVVLTRGGIGYIFKRPKH
jgi:hypothetical protein